MTKKDDHTDALDNWINDKFLELYTIMCRTISKPTRLKILQLIGKNKLSVKEIQERLRISPSSLSNHLNDLYRAGILKKEKEGINAIYSLADPKLINSISRMMESIKAIIDIRDNLV